MGIRFSRQQASCHITVVDQPPGTANPHIDIADMPALHAFPSKTEKPPGPLVSGGIPIRVTLPLRIERMISHALEGREFGAASVV
jgi:hypothetical protein